MASRVWIYSRTWLKIASMKETLEITYLKHFSECQQHLELFQSPFNSPKFKSPTSSTSTPPKTPCKEIKEEVKKKRMIRGVGEWSLLEFFLPKWGRGRRREQLGVRGLLTQSFKREKRKIERVEECIWHLAIWEGNNNRGEEIWGKNKGKWRKKWGNNINSHLIQVMRLNKFIYDHRQSLDFIS